MGHKIITEKDFWQCTGGAVPSQFQSGQKIAELSLPESCVITMLERKGELTLTTPEMELRPTDEIVIIGEPVDLQELVTQNETIDKISDEES